MYDIIVVGGGPAGLTSAVYALRAGKSVFVIEKNGFGGQIANSPKVENIPGIAQIKGSEFADRLLDQAMALGAEVELETVVSVANADGFKRVATEEGGEYTARTVILATGVRHRMLGIAGEEELVGHGISFCAVCDGAFCAGSRAAVIGGGNSALQEAILLSETCSEVVIIQNLPDFTGERKLAEALAARKNVRTAFSTVVTDFITSGGELTGLKLKNEVTGEATSLDIEAAFIAVGLAPENDAFAQLAQLDSHGYFASGEDCNTRSPGIFTAGDCRAKSVRQVATACADGAVAALAAVNYIDSSGF